MLRSYFFRNSSSVSTDTPSSAAFRFFPWSLMLWAPFCPALIAIERNPLLIKYHRILFVVLGLLIWFNPQTKPRDFFYLLPDDVEEQVEGHCEPSEWALKRR